MKTARDPNVAFGILMIVMPLPLAIAALFVENVTLAPAAPTLAKVGKAYGIVVDHAGLSFPSPTVGGDIDGKEASQDALRQYAPLFAREMSLYPRSLIERANLRRVVLCDHLHFGGDSYGGCADVAHDTIYLNVPCGSHRPTYLSAAVHHELFHVIDYRDDGTLSLDERWASLNPPNFWYGSRGDRRSNKDVSVLFDDRVPGFLTHYATTAVEEDKAEVFAHMIVNASYVERQARRDPVLRAKVARMKEMLAAFCPDIDAAFWERVKAVRRPGG